MARERMGPHHDLNLRIVYDSALPMTLGMRGSVRALPPTQAGPRSKRGDREVVNAVIWRVRTGVPWRDLPGRFGAWQTIYNRFSRWAKRGVWERLFKELAIEADDAGSLVDVIRYDRTATSFLAAVHVACLWMWLVD